MADYELYYWSVPFRGQFVRAILAFAGRSWTEVDDGTISKLMGGPVEDMPVPFMGPPILVDNKTEAAVSEMPAIVLYLGETLNLLPADPWLRALTIKVAADANDVIDELTIDGGKQMWTEQRWKDELPRLKKWMSLWEDLGRRHGLKADSGFLLGGERPGIADVITTILWSTMGDRFPKLKAMLKEVAPYTAALADRVGALPPIARLAAKARDDYGTAWSGGEIEKSLRKVLDA